MPSECLVRGAQVVGKKVPIENDDDGPPAGCSTDDPGASKENGAQQRPLASSKQPFKPPASGAYKPPGLAKAGGGGAGGGSKLPMPRAGLSKATPTPSARPGAGASTRPTGTKAAPKKDKRRVLESDEESEDDAEESEESEESDGEAESDGDAESDGAEEEGVDEDVAEVAAGGGSDEADTGHDSASMKVGCRHGVRPRSPSRDSFADSRRCSSLCTEEGRRLGSPPCGTDDSTQRVCCVRRSAGQLGWGVDVCLLRARLLSGRQQPGSGRWSQTAQLEHEASEANLRRPCSSPMVNGQCGLPDAVRAAHTADKMSVPFVPRAVADCSGRFRTGLGALSTAREGANEFTFAHNSP